MFNKRESKAVTQKNFDKITQLPEHLSTKEPVFLIGNDPVILITDNHKELENKFVVIGTSGLRVIELAFKISGINPDDPNVGNKNLPIIILMDNSKIVCEFWNNLKKTLASKDNETPKLLGENLKRFFRENSKDSVITMNHELRSYAPHVEYPDQERVLHYTFFEIFNKYGLENVRKVILDTIVVRQSWTHKETFATIKKLLEKDNIHTIYMYPSNIVACSESAIDRKKILDNIKMMDPKLAIHTDRTVVRSIFSAHGQPMKVHMVTDHNPDQVSQLVPFVKAQPYISKKQMLVMLFLMFVAAYQYLGDQDKTNDMRPTSKFM